MSDVTQILSAIEGGDQKAAEELLPLVYDELRKLAAAKMAQEKPGQTLQATALVHEAYVRLVDDKPAGKWNACCCIRRLCRTTTRRRSEARGTDQRAAPISCFGVSPPDSRALLPVSSNHPFLTHSELVQSILLCIFTRLDRIVEEATAKDQNRGESPHRHNLLMLVAARLVVS